jgi:trk system potassium uptake protein TrkH
MEGDTLAFLYSIAITIISGLILRSAGSLKGTIGIKEGFLIVALGWMLAGIFGSLPYIFYGAVESPIDGIFEAISGFTTTGATIIDDIEVLPHGILFWRSFTHWLGGMGIIVLFLALLPKFETGGMQLFRAEVPGPKAEKVSPRLTETAKVLWFIYVGISFAQTVLLMLTGFSLFDALTHTFGTVATGGFSTRNLSVGAFNNPAAEIVIIVFMIIAGGNFALYYGLLKGQWKKLIDDGEFRFYIGFITFTTLFISVNIIRQVPDFLENIRTSLFQVVSIMTTTGFTTADFDTWPTFSRLTLLILMFVGGCAGSTGGAIKQIRILLLLKHCWRELFKMIHPKAVISLKVGGRNVQDDIVKNILAFTTIYFLIFIFGSLFMSFLGLDLITAITSVAATLGNIGPGLGLVGPLHTYSHIHWSGKIVLSMFMLLGRLELYTIILCFMPEFWKGIDLPFKRDSHGKVYEMKY